MQILFVLTVQSHTMGLENWKTTRKQQSFGRTHAIKVELSVPLHCMSSAALLSFPYLFLSEQRTIKFLFDLLTSATVEY
jgi:hypothetical protein